MGPVFELKYCIINCMKKTKNKMQSWLAFILGYDNKSLMISTLFLSTAVNKGVL